MCARRMTIRIGTFQGLKLGVEDHVAQLAVYLFCGVILTGSPRPTEPSSSNCYGVKFTSLNSRPSVGQEWEIPIDLQVGHFLWL